MTRSSIFNDLYNVGLFYTSSSSYPYADLVKLSDNKTIQIRLAVAGFKKSDLTVSQSNKNVLTIQGFRQEPTEDVEYILKGISTKNFTKQFQLSPTVTVNKIVLEDGILTISLNKINEDEEKSVKFDIQ